MPKGDADIARITLGFFRDNKLATYFRCTTSETEELLFGYITGENADVSDCYSYRLVT